LVKSKKKVEILIIGATGFLGYHLAKKCLKLKWNVTSFSLHKPKKKRFLKKVKYFFGDISNRKKLKKIDKNFEYVVNLGGYVDHINKKKTYLSHYIGCKNLVKIFEKKKIKSFLHIGSSSEYENNQSPHKENQTCNPKSIYGHAKNMATKYLIKKFKKNNFPSTVIRLYQVFGIKQDVNRIVPFIIQSCIEDKSFPCSEGTQLRDFIEVEQVVNAFIKTIKSEKAKGEIINIGSGQPIKIKYLINKICKLIKKGNPQFGKIKIRKDEKKIFYPNIKKAKKLINWAPKKNFHQAIIKQIKSQKHNDKQP
jgi:nucleoside-diphosphate-sugar epimerase